MNAAKINIDPETGNEAAENCQLNKYPEQQ